MDWANAAIARLTVKPIANLDQYPMKTALKIASASPTSPETVDKAEGDKHDHSLRDFLAGNSEKHRS